MATPAQQLPQIPITPADRPTFGDRVFRSLCVASAFTALVIVASTFIFMISEARPAFRQAGIIGFFSKSIWNGSTGQFGVWGILVGTIIIAIIGLIVAVPTALAMALFINEYAPARIGRILTSAIDLLAALPSLVFGMWGFYAFKDHLVTVSEFLSVHLVALPFFRLSEPSARLTGSSFIAGVVVGMMIMPIICSISREVMGRVPRDLCEGALALGGTRWGMIKSVVLPFGRSGIFGAALLGFGRALGETIAVALLIGNVDAIANLHVLEQGAGSVAALIAIRFGEASSLERSGLVAAGLSLLLLTFTVSLISRYIISRKAVR